NRSGGRTLSVRLINEPGFGRLRDGQAPSRWSRYTSKPSRQNLSRCFPVLHAFAFRSKGPSFSGRKTVPAPNIPAFVHLKDDSTWPFPDTLRLNPSSHTPIPNE